MTFSGNAIYILLEKEDSEIELYNRRGFVCCKIKLIVKWDIEKIMIFSPR